MEIKNKDEYELIVTAIINNYFGCDILLSLFISALESYRADKCLRPFPPMFVSDSDKDIEKLRKICKSLPSLDTILKNPNACSEDVKKLLIWIFYRKDGLQLRRTNISEIKLPFPIKKSFVPHYTYEIVYSEKAELAWQKLKGNRKSFLVYHGSQLDYFYSILSVGLQQHFGITKEHLYGNGIYLTTEISLSIMYAPFSQTWLNSTIGNKMSVVAFCEVIDDCEKVKCIDSKYKDRSRNEGSISGNIPDKYFVVTDSDMVRVKYLFVYKSKSLSKISSWFYNNIILILIILYAIVLLSIGFFQKPTWIKLKRTLYRMIDLQEIEN